MTLISLIFSLYFLSKQKNEVFDSLTHEALGIAKSIAFVNSDAIILDEGSFIVEFTTEFIKDNKDLRTIIISKPDGSNFLIERDKWLYKKDLLEEFASLQTDKNVLKIIKSPILNEEVFHFVYPLVFSEINWGWLHLSIDLKDYNDKTYKIYFQFFIFLAVLFIVSMILSFLIAKSISSPIIELNNTAKKISRGDFKLRSAYDSNNELGELANTFNKMMTTIEESQIKLEQINDKLEDRVKERTKEIKEKNRLLHIKTSELKELNRNLDERVKIEVNKRREQETMLLQQSRLAAMGEMIGNIAHQWRQPLSLITTAITGMKIERELGMSEKKEEDKKLDAVLKSANYLSNTIEDFRNFFKRDKVALFFNIKEQAEHSLNLVYATLKASHILVERDFRNVEDNLGYPNEFAQAILNILTNAKDALIENKVREPKIIVRIFSIGKYNILEIEDNAGGIERSIIDKIFEPYYTTKHQSQGTGIGLYMTKMIIEQNMDGKLSVRNGLKGAIFTVKLYKEEN